MAEPFLSLSAKDRRDALGVAADRLPARYELQLSSDGGLAAFPELAGNKSARDRIVSPAQVIKAVPEVILASWCGKKVRSDRIAARPGWNRIPAVRDGRIVEIKSSLILRPGPAALTDGLDAIIVALA